MHRERGLSVPHEPSETDYLIRSPSVKIQDYLERFFALPEAFREGQVDHEQTTWSSDTLLCASVFLDDAVHYRSAAHKVTRRHLLIYRWFASPMIEKLHQLILLLNLCLAFFEWPSSFSVTSDIRDQPNRIEFSHYLLMSIEGLTLLWLLIYISAKIACLGVRHVRKRFWILLFSVLIVYSLCEWFTTLVLLNRTYQSFRLRRIFRPIFLIESSQLMKKALKALHKDLLTIVACISLALIHILFFAAMAMFLFPRSDARPESQGSTYFSSLHDALFHLLVLSSTANNPDIMMPAYTDNRLNVLFFIIFVIIGIYWIQNIVTAVVYRAFRGYFLNSIINSLLRRRVAIRASFEVLRTCLSQDGCTETRDTIPISIVQTVVTLGSMEKWHADRIHQKLSDLSRDNDTINQEQFCALMQWLDLNPQLARETEIPPLGTDPSDQFKAIGRSKAFDLLGTVLSLVSVGLVTAEVSHRHRNADYADMVDYTLPIAVTNLVFMIYFVLETMIKLWSFGPMNFFRSSSMNLFETLVAVTCLGLQIIYLAINGSPTISLNEIELKHDEKPFLTLWAAIKMCNMFFIYRLVRFLPASKNIQIIVATVIDEIRNGGAFFGVLFSFYYAYSILGMELFQGAADTLYQRYNRSNLTVCGTYEQLQYWPNAFDDFYSSMVTLYNIMIVNQWFVFVKAFRDATQSRWSELYFIFWYLFVTTIGLNMCLALSGDIYEAKKKRADRHEELIVSNMFDIYRSQLTEPSPEQVTQRLNEHPYINFRQNPSDTAHLA